MAFTDLFALPVRQQWQMNVLGDRVSQAGMEINLSWRRRKQVSAAHDLVDATGGIINYDGQLIGKHPVSTMQDEITDSFREDLLHGPKHPIGKANLFIRDDDPQSARLAPRSKPGTTGTRIDGALLARMRSTSKNFLTRTGAVKDQSLVAQHFYRGLVCFATPALPDDLTIPMQPELVQCEQNIIRSTRHNSGHIQVFHA